MINAVFIILVLLGIAISIISGDIKPLITGITSSTADSVSLFVTLIGTYTLWLGILNIAKKSGLIQSLSKHLTPIIHFLFSDIPKNSKANGLITLNITANMLGMGNAATPFGLSAMEELRKLCPNSNTPSDAMCMLLIINTTSVQLLPLTVISLRAAAGSYAPEKIIITSLITTTVTTLCGITLAKVYTKFKSHRERRVR